MKTITMALLVALNVHWAHCQERRVLATFSAESPARISGMIVNKSFDGHVIVFVEEQGLPITEGYYLGLAVSEDGQKPERWICRTQVTEIGDDDTIVVKMTKAALDKFGKRIVLMRPSNSSTKSMETFPSMVPAIVKSNSELSPELSSQLLESKRDLQRIGLAMHYFHDVHKRFPPAFIAGPDGKPWHSWRVLLLPYLDETKLYEQYSFEEPWNGPNNKRLIDTIPDTYRASIFGDEKSSYAHYAVAVGRNAPFSSAGGKFTVGQEPLEGIRGGRPITEFRDGLANCILVGSMGPEHAVPWTKPEDVHFKKKSSLGTPKGFAMPYNSKRGQAGLFLMGDGYVQTILASVDETVFANLISIDDRVAIGDVPTLDSKPADEDEIRFVIRLVQEGERTFAELATETITEHQPGQDEDK